MHPKLTEHGKSCMQINQLPTKSSNDVTDKFNTLDIRQQVSAMLRINEKWKRTGYEGKGMLKSLM